MPFYKKPIPTRSISLSRGAGRVSELDSMPEEKYQEMIGLIRLGAFPQQAAIAVGISVRSFNEWIRRGCIDLEANEESIYSCLVIDVNRAHAKARIQAEVKVKADSPLQWLKYAAKTTAVEAGWSDDAREVHVTHEGEVQHPVSIELQQQRVEDMSSAIQLLQGLGLDPEKIVDARSVSVFHDTVDPSSISEVDDTADEE